MDTENKYKENVDHPPGTHHQVGATTNVKGKTNTTKTPEGSLKKHGKEKLGGKSDESGHSAESNKKQHHSQSNESVSGKGGKSGTNTHKPLRPPHDPTQKPNAAGPEISGKKGNVTIIGNNEEEIKKEDIVTAPDGGWGWMVVFGAFMSNLIAEGIVLSFGLKDQPFRETFSDEGQAVTASQIAWVPSLLLGMYFLAGPIASILANNFGFRVVAIIGAIIASIGFLLAYLLCRVKSNLTALYVFNGVFGGIGLGLVFMPSVIAVSYYFEKRRALATSICLSGSGVGQFVFGPLTFYLINKFGWKVLLSIETGFILLTTVGASLYRPLEPPASEGHDADSDSNHSPSQESIKSQEGTKSAPQGVSSEKLGHAAAATPSNSDHEHKEDHKMAVPKKAPGVKTPNKAGAAVGVGKAKGAIKPTNTNKRKVAPLSSSNPKIVKKKVGKSTYEVDEATGDRQLHVVSADSETINQPMYRDDIFYRGNMKRIPAYKELVDKGEISKEEWSAMMANKPESKNKHGKKGTCSKKCRGCTKMLGLSLFTSPTFIIFSISGVLTMVVFFVPYTYLEGVAVQNGLDNTLVPQFFAIIGVANMLGRLMCGLLADSPKVNVIIFNSVSLCIAGAATVAVPFLKDYRLFIAYSVTFGLSTAWYISLISIYIVELMGLDNLTNAFGLSNFFQGVSIILGIPLAGFLYEATGTYDLSFFVSGGAIFISGAMLFPIGYINRWEKRNKIGILGRQAAHNQPESSK